jgi:hypothetical protein
MSREIEIVAVENTPSDNGFDWWEGAFHIGELDVISVNDMVTKVIARAGGRQIRGLTIIGHGAPGFQSVGAGQGADTGGRSLNIDPATNLLRGDGERELSRLSGRFAPGAVITLGGCRVAEGAVGRALLQRISTLLGNVIVEGAEVIQNPLPGMEGTVIRCRGNACWVHAR